MSLKIRVKNKDLKLELISMPYEGALRAGGNLPLRESILSGMMR